MAVRHLRHGVAYCMCQQLFLHPTALLSPAGAAATHGHLQQVTAVLLAVVAAMSLGNAAGGAPRAPATLAHLLRAPELAQHLQKGNCYKVSLLRVDTPPSQTAMSFFGQLAWAVR